MSFVIIFSNNIKFSVVDAVMCGPDSLPKLSHCLSSWWNGLNKVFQLRPSSGLILSQTHHNAPLQKQSWSQDCFIQLYQGLAPRPQSGTTFEGSCLIHDSPWGCLRPLFQQLCTSPFSCPILPSFILLVSGAPPPINLPHTTLKWMFPSTWPITLLLPVLLQKCSYFVRFLLSSASSHCLNSPISAIFNVWFWKQSHMDWLLEVLLEGGKSLFL